MFLKNYKYGNTEFAVDISRIHYIAKDGSKNIVIFLNREEHLITFDSYREREKAYEDIIKDIDEINKPDEPCRMYPEECFREDKRYCETCAHLGELGWECFEHCSEKYREAWIPKI